MTHVQPDKEDMVTQSDRQVLVWCADPGDWTYEQLCACILPIKKITTLSWIFTIKSESPLRAKRAKSQGFKDCTKNNVESKLLCTQMFHLKTKMKKVLMSYYINLDL